MVYGSGVIPTENPESISTASDRKTQTVAATQAKRLSPNCAYDDTAAISLSGPVLSRSSFRTADHFTVRVFQPVDHGNRQGHGDNIEGLATHKMVTALGLIKGPAKATIDGYTIDLIRQVKRSKVNREFVA